MFPLSNQTLNNFHNDALNGELFNGNDAFDDFFAFLNPNYEPWDQSQNPTQVLPSTPLLLELPLCEPNDKLLTRYICSYNPYSNPIAQFLSACNEKNFILAFQILPNIININEEVDKISPLQMATIHNQLDMVDFILNQAEIGPLIEEEKIHPALTYALKNNFFEVSRLLIEHLKHSNDLFQTFLNNLAPPLINRLAYSNQENQFQLLDYLIAQYPTDSSIPSIKNAAIPLPIQLLFDSFIAASKRFNLAQIIIDFFLSSTSSQKTINDLIQLLVNQSLLEGILNDCLIEDITRQNTSFLTAIETREPNKIKTILGEDKNRYLNLACQFEAIEAIAFLCQNDLCDLKKDVISFHTLITSYIDSQTITENQFKIIYLLQNHGLNIFPNNSKKNLLHFLSSQKDLTISSSLLQSFILSTAAHINDRDEEGNTPLHLALTYNNPLKSLMYVPQINLAVQSNAGFNPFEALLIHTAHTSLCNNPSTFIPTREEFCYLAQRSPLNFHSSLPIKLLVIWATLPARYFPTIEFKDAKMIHFKDAKMIHTTNSYVLEPQELLYVLRPTLISTSLKNYDFKKQKQTNQDIFLNSIVNLLECDFKFSLDCLSEFLKDKNISSQPTIKKLFAFQNLFSPTTKLDSTSIPFRELLLPTPPITALIQIPRQITIDYISTLSLDELFLLTSTFTLSISCFLPLLSYLSTFKFENFKAENVLTTTGIRRLFLSYLVSRSSEPTSQRISYSAPFELEPTAQYTHLAPYIPKEYLINELTTFGEFLKNELIFQFIKPGNTPTLFVFSEHNFFNRFSNLASDVNKSVNISSFIDHKKAALEEIFPRIVYFNQKMSSAKEKVLEILNPIRIILNKDFNSVYQACEEGQFGWLKKIVDSIRVELDSPPLPSIRPENNLRVRISAIAPEKDVLQSCASYLDRAAKLLDSYIFPLINSWIATQSTQLNVRPNQPNTPLLGADVHDVAAINIIRSSISSIPVSTANDRHCPKTKIENILNTYKTEFPTLRKKLMLAWIIDSSPEKTLLLEALSEFRPYKTFLESLMSGKGALLHPVAFDKDFIFDPWNTILKKNYCDEQNYRGLIMCPRIAQELFILRLLSQVVPPNFPAL